MYSLGVFLGPNQQLSFLYKAFKNADEAYRKVAIPIASPESTGSFAVAGDVHGAVEITDDFGQISSLRYSAITAVWLADLDKDSEGNIERSLHQARSQVTLNRKANADPMLKTEAMVRGDAARMNGPMRMS